MLLMRFVPISSREVIIGSCRFKARQNYHLIQGQLSTYNNIPDNGIYTASAADPCSKLKCVECKEVTPVKVQIRLFVL